MNDDFCQMMEIDDNLAGSDLSALELSVFLVQRKRVYERLHPETRKGAAGGHAKAGSTTDTMSFARSVAEQRALSPRHIRRFVRIGEVLRGWEVDMLSALEQPLGVKDLLDLANANYEQRQGAVRILGAGEAETAKEALSLATGPRPAAPDELKVSALRKAWMRASVAERAEFVAIHDEELQRMLGGDA